MRKQEGGGGVLGSQITVGEVDGVRQATNGVFFGGKEQEKGTSSPKRKRLGKTKHNMVLPTNIIDQS